MPNRDYLHLDKEKKIKASYGSSVLVGQILTSSVNCQENPVSPGGSDGEDFVCLRGENPGRG